MSYNRIIATKMYSTGDALTRDLAGIGFKIGSSKSMNPNIEDTLIAAAIEGMNGDFRVLSLLVDWFETHYHWVNTDRLLRAVKEIQNPRVKLFFSSIGFWLQKDPRYKRLIRVYRGSREFLGLSSSYQFLVERNGHDERFAGTKLIVAKNHLRKRQEDITTSKELALLHQDYFYRVLIGPSYRADMVSLFKRSPQLSPTELARKTYGSFKTAWDVINDMTILKLASA